MLRAAAILLLLANLAYFAWTQGHLASVGLAPIEARLWMMAVPILGQDLLLVDVLRGEPIDAASLLVSGAVSIALTVVCLAATARLFRSERIIFAR